MILRDDEFELELLKDIGVEPIRSFQGEYRFLSNFYPAPVIYWGYQYPTVEHAYQAAKAQTHRDRELIRKAETPGVAKRLGRQIRRRPWSYRERLDTMKLLVQRKFRHHPDLTAQLLATGDRELVEGNEWGDTFWGIYQGGGSNHLGRILMEVREELRR